MSNRKLALLHPPQIQFCKMCNEQTLFKVQGTRLNSKTGMQEPRYSCAPCRNRRMKALQEKKVQEFYSQDRFSCIWCGYNINEAFDWHHIDPDLKKHDVGRLIRAGNFKEAWKESGICVLLCACCHRLTHADILPIDPAWAGMYNIEQRRKTDG